MPKDTRKQRRIARSIAAKETNSGLVAPSTKPLEAVIAPQAETVGLSSQIQDSSYALTRESGWIPRLATSKEFPDSTELAYVNAIARGEQAEELSRKMVENPRRFVQLTSEGISRWQTRSKER